MMSFDPWAYRCVRSIEGVGGSFDAGKADAGGEPIVKQDLHQLKECE